MKESFLKSFLIISIKINFLQNISLYFLPDDSCIPQLLYIALEINLSFDCDPTIDESGVCLDVCKAVCKVWHKRILFKVTTYDQ